LTGDIAAIRPYIMLLLLKKGFKVVENPAKGVKGLICGSQHEPSKEVASHLKYKRAIKNNVPIIGMDGLSQMLGIEDLNEEIQSLKQGIIFKRCGNGQHMINFIW
jgi:hypothetical protein